MAIFAKEERKKSYERILEFHCENYPEFKEFAEKNIPLYLEALEKGEFNFIEFKKMCEEAVGAVNESALFIGTIAYFKEKNPEKYEALWAEYEESKDDFEKALRKYFKGE